MKSRWNLTDEELTDMPRDMLERRYRDLLSTHKFIWIVGAVSLSLLILFTFGFTLGIIKIVV